jgi:hypothetical protein
MLVDQIDGQLECHVLLYSVQRTHAFCA